VQPLHRQFVPRTPRASIEAQRQAVATYLNGGNWRIVAEFTEIESGKRSDRPALDKALAAASDPAGRGQG
jgi:DNA invertase Pin-like site-specific DNA recombinase